MLFYWSEIIKSMKNTIYGLSTLLIQWIDIIILQCCVLFESPTKITLIYLISLMLIEIMFVYLIYTSTVNYQSFISDSSEQKKEQIYYTLFSLILFICLLNVNGMNFTKFVVFIQLFLSSFHFVHCSKEDLRSSLYLSMFCLDIDEDNDFISSVFNNYNEDDEILNQLIKINGAFRKQSYHRKISTIQFTNQLQYEYEECPICYQQFELHQNIIQLPCNHYFDDCIHIWLRKHFYCPLCHSSI